MNYDAFKKDVLYAVARNGGSLYEDSLPEHLRTLDRLDYHLHLRQMKDERLVERLWTTGQDDVLVIASWKPSKPYLSLQDDGWDWVRKDRALDTPPESKRESNSSGPAGS